MRTRTTIWLFALMLFATVAAAEQGVGGYRATVTPDNRLKYTLGTADFTFTRTTDVDNGETEITLAGPNEAPVVIRFGGAEGISVERGAELVTIRPGEDNALTAATLLTGRGVRAFRGLVGTYEREIATNDAASVTSKAAPFAYSLLLTAAFVSELAGDPNAMARTRDLIRRRIAAKLRAAAWQQQDCVTDYERALLANDTRNTQCLESANNLDSFWDRAGARLLCSAEFLAGALSAETQFIGCSGLSPLKIQ